MVVGEIDDEINLEADDLTISTNYDNQGRVISETNVLGLTRDYEYDEDGNLTAVILPEVTHPITSQMVRPRYEYEYDSYGNRTVIRDNIVQIGSTVYYDHDGVTGDDSRETVFTFNDLGQQLTRTLPSTETESTSYDSIGRQDQMIDFEGNIVDYLFTDNDLLEEIKYYLPGSNPAVDDPDETVMYTYDDQKNITSIIDDRGTTSYVRDADSQLIQISTLEGTLNYEYDDLTHLIDRVTTGDPAVSMTNDTRYTYDELNRLEAVTVYERNDVVLSTPETTTYSYDAIGNLVRIDQANGVVTTYEYDDLYRLDLLIHYAPDSTPNDLSDNDKLSQYAYTVQADGRKTGTIETHWENGTPYVDTFTWAYDNSGRLVTETLDSYDNTLDFEANYTYDLVGNRLKKQVDIDLDSDIDEMTTYTYNNADQLLTESTVIGLVDDGVNLETDDTTATYSYTGTQLTGKEVKATYADEVISNTTSEFNLQGRLSKVTIDTYTSGVVSKQEVTEYEYDVKGIRVSSHHTVDEGNDSTLEVDEMTTYLNDPYNPTGYSQVLEEVTYDNLVQTETERTIFTLGLDLINQVTFDSLNSNGLHATFLYGGHGSTRILTDFLGAISVYNSVLQIFRYDAYGQALGFDPSTSLTNILYSGEWFDNRIQQQYLRARFYDAATGRFNRLDPFYGNLKDPQSLHKYLYTHGDPVNGVDPSGNSYVAIFAVFKAFTAITSLSIGVENILRSHMMGNDNAKTRSFYVQGLLFGISQGLSLGAGAVAGILGGINGFLIGNAVVDGWIAVSLLGEYSARMQKNYYRGTGGYEGDNLMVGLVQNVLNEWNQTNLQTKKNALFNMHYSSIVVSAWDIKDMLGERKAEWSQDPVTQDHKYLKYTMSFRSAVYPVAEVNYTLWGMANRLAYEDNIYPISTNWYSTLGLVVFYKLISSPAFLFDTPFETITGKTAFADYGWTVLGALNGNLNGRNVNWNHLKGEPLEEQILRATHNNMLYSDVYLRNKLKFMLGYLIDN
ncbi:tRNA nuclease WapA precursor [Polystyrenella longa]|uniref:tRNA nuclease WapA n=1 Tax=Polystyrenella longa TaxID=2528007 RepID=A0A518CTK6_9PLAN|nr:RHS repeat-associated core domain-containing protein [Polystyrenella longa]QDU82504.1 tRNA nuclease WapA precursor [Polystyrenella longa]